MARTAITVQQPATILPFFNPSVSATAADLVWTAATGSSGSSGNQCVYTDKLLVLAINTHASTDYTVTFTSRADSHGRSGDVTSYQVLHANTVSAFMFVADGWRQNDGNLYFEANNAAVKFAIIQLP